MSRLQSYTQKYTTPRYTEAQMREMAENRYLPEHNEKVQGLKQGEAQTQQALENQLAKLEMEYGRNRESLAQNIQNTYAAANRQSLSRGMQRSSYNNANLNNINLQGVSQQNKLAESHGLAKNEINSKSTLLKQQLAEQLQRLESDKVLNMNKYIDDLRKEQDQRIFQETQAYNDMVTRLMQIDPEGYGIASAESGGGGGGRRTGGGGGGGGKNTNTTNNKGFALIQNILKNASGPRSPMNGHVSTANPSLARTLNKGKQSSTTKNGVKYTRFGTVPK